MKRDFTLNIEKGDKIMKCVEYIYDEKEANEFIEKLKREKYEEIEVVKTIDEDADIPCDVWVVSWKPKEIR